MTWKRLLMACAILIGSGAAFFFFHQTENRDISLKQPSVPTTAEIREKYPHLPPPPPWDIRKTLREKSTLTWEEWIDTHVELNMAIVLDRGWEYGWIVEKYDTPEKLAALEAEYRKLFSKVAERYRSEGLGVPPTADASPTPPEAQPIPQTPEAIMAAFDKSYSPYYSADMEADMDAAYPRAEWIQAFLDRGARFENASDYEVYLKERQTVMRYAGDPDEWASGRFGVKPSHTFEGYKNALIDRHIWVNETFKRIRAENPGTGVVFFEGDKYLAPKPNQTYVRRNGPSTITWGTPLTQEERQNLVEHGVHPEGIEIIYVDKDLNVLSEKPAPYNPTVGSIPLDTDDTAIGELAPGDLQHFTDGHVVGNTEGFERQQFDIDTDASRAAAKEVAQKAQQDFDNSLRQWERFLNMSDAEFEAELERLFTPQLPDHPTDKSIDDQLQEQFTPNQLNPRQFEKALKTLNRYGVKDGLRRIKAENPTFAKQLENYLQRESERE